jgi:superfamily II DNA or RNA helicase
MNRVDRFIASCLSWDDFWQRTRQLSKSEMGRAFERLVQLYLQTAPEYRTILQDVWTLREVPAQVRKLLRLPSSDEGIDLIARTWQGEYWAIQSKFRNERDKPLNRTNLGTFHALAFNTCNDIALAVVAHTCTLPVAKHHLMRDTVEIGFDRWQAADWALIVAGLKGESTIPVPRRPRPHQAGAIFAAKDHFIRDEAARGRLIMPCGSGKSLAAYWIAQSLEAKTILVAVPSLELIRKSVTDWTREFLASGQVPNWVCVCSDESVGNLDQDEFVSEVYELGLPTLTEPEKIASVLRTPSKGSRIVFTTYQSSKNLADGARKAGVEFDLVILDEAHRTVGVRSKPFATLLRDEQLKARRRLFMTATERVLREDNDEVLSMDNEDDYGKCFFQLSYKDAIAQGIISDYKIVTIAISDEEVSRVIEENRILNLHPELDEAEARTVAIAVALKQVLKDRGITHTISFHHSIRAADRFRDQADVLNVLPPQTTNFHISSKQTAGQRAETMREFERESRALMTNARCLTEGVDVPAIDCVVFADPKQSTIDIVQAAGRALRVSPGKDYGYILLPIVVPEGKNFEEFVQTTAFREIARIVAALSTHDGRIADEFRAIQQGRIPTGKIVEIVGNVPVGLHMSLEQFAEAISTRIWASVGRANWRSFEEARDFARKLGLKSHIEWWGWSSGKLKDRGLGELPPDIPATPERVYSEHWKGWGDWLGHGRQGKWVAYRPFEAAREYARSLNLKSYKEWKTLAKDRSVANKNRLPDDIPAFPNHVYDEWIGWWDWLGTPHRRGSWMPYADARALARTLGLDGETEFIKWRRGSLKHKVKCPADMPMHPDRVYPEFKDWPDFLGFTAAPTMTFEEAKAFVQRIGIKTQWEYREWVSGHLRRHGLPVRPKNIPTNPHRTYSAVWKGWNDFLGTPVPRNMQPAWRPFKEAREYVRAQKLASVKEYWKWTRGELKDRPPFPDDIPKSPYDVYGKEKDWKGMSDFLGIKPLPKYVEWWPFRKARRYVRNLALVNSDKYRKWANGGRNDLPEKPAEVPAQPWVIYRNEWCGWDDWLGNGRVVRGSTSIALRLR